jgi:hypothetical protein
MRNSGVGLLPGYFRRGFSDAFDDDDSRGKKAKKVDDFPIPDGSRKRDPLPMFKVFLDQGNEKFDATPWSRLDGDYTTFETSPVTQVPLPARKPTETYWRWALPFVSKDAWDGKKVWTDGEKPMAWGPRTLDSWERLFVGAPDSTPEPHVQDKFRLYADKEYPAKLSSLPPPWTKEGVEYVKKNGIGDFVAEFVGDVRLQPYTGEQGSSSRIDGKWGTYSPFFKDDPLKDDTIAKTLAALSDAASQRYTSTDGTGGVPWLRSNVLTEGSLFGLLWSKGGRGKKKTVDPEKEAAAINTLRILSEAFSKRIGYNKRKPYKNDAVVLNFYKLWALAGERYGSDMSEFQTYIKDLEQIAKKRAAADTRESDDYDDAALANTLRDLSKSSADWAEKRKKGK